MKTVLQENFVRKNALGGIIVGWICITLGFIVIMRGLIWCFFDSSVSLAKINFYATFSIAGEIILFFGVACLLFSVLLRSLYEIKQAIEKESNSSDK